MVVFAQRGNGVLRDPLPRIEPMTAGAEQLELLHHLEEPCLAALRFRRDDVQVRSGVGSVDHPRMRSPERDRVRLRLVDYDEAVDEDFDLVERSAETLILQFTLGTFTHEAFVLAPDLLGDRIVRAARWRGSGFSPFEYSDEVCEVLGAAFESADVAPVEPVGDRLSSTRPRSGL
jgi:hypothetical protein